MHFLPALFLWAVAAAAIGAAPDSKRSDPLLVRSVIDGDTIDVARVPLSRLPKLQHAEAEAQAFRRGMCGGRTADSDGALYSAVSRFRLSRIPLRAGHEYRKQGARSTLFR